MCSGLHIAVDIACALPAALQSAIYLMNVENADTNEAEIPGLELFVWGLLANVGIGLLSSWLG